MGRKLNVICCVGFLMLTAILFIRSYDDDKIILELPTDLLESIDEIKERQRIHENNKEEHIENQKQLNKSRSGVLKSFRQFYDYVENPASLCNNEKVFGGIYSYSKEHYFDGDKIVCMDPRFNISSKNCKIYSFGISGEWSFDDAIAKYGCRVYAFDPTMSKKYNPKFPNTVYIRGNRIYFFPIGLGGKDYTTKIGKKTCELRRMKTILEFLVHNKTDIIIDYLKIDIEGSELEFLEDLLYKTPNLLFKFNQIGLEIHPKIAHKNNWQLFSDYYKYFMELENRGYRLFSSRMNPQSSTKYMSKSAGRIVNQFYEMVWARF